MKCRYPGCVIKLEDKQFWSLGKPRKDIMYGNAEFWEELIASEPDVEEVASMYQFRAVDPSSTSSLCRCACATRVPNANRITDNLWAELEAADQ